MAKLSGQLKTLRSEAKKAQKKLAEVQAKIKKSATKDLAEQLKQLQQKADGLRPRIRLLQAQQRRLSHTETVACVDSELMLLWWEPYPLHRWQPNLLHFRIDDKARNAKPPVLMVSRLDGPSLAIANRLVDDAVAVEKQGLTGKVYVDARGIRWNQKKDTGYGYGGYDESLREMAALLKKAKLPVVLDDKSALFKPESCPQTALYCGWYSLARYVPCCKFTKGAVAYHIASAEAVTLRNAKAKYWCPNLLQAGVCATMGPVAEPYTIGFPKPAEFFGFLVTGEYNTLVECYSKTQMLASWMTVLVGDPLYNPFKHNRRLRSEQVQPSPGGCRYLFRLH